MKTLYSLSLGVAMSGAALLGAASTTRAQDADADPKAPVIGNSPIIGKLETCTAITDDAERLACFDREVGALVGATSQGEVKVVESEEISEVRKKLYGYSIPDAGIFASETQEEKEEARRLVSTITKVRQVSSKEWHFWIEEGNAKWRIKSTSVRFRAPKVGDEVEFKPASMGTYWIRVDGRKGVRGNRIG